MRRKKDGTLGFITKRRLTNEQKYLESSIASAKKCKDYRRVQILRATYHAIPGAIEEANAGRRIVNTENLYRLDGQCGNALARRGLDTKIGAKRLCVEFSVALRATPQIEPVMAWYAPFWFTNMIHNMPNRRPFYKKLEKLAKEGEDAIDEYLGLLILGEM